MKVLVFLVLVVCAPSVYAQAVPPTPPAAPAGKLPEIHERQFLVNVSPGATVKLTGANLKDAKLSIVLNDGTKDAIVPESAITKEDSAVSFVVPTVPLRRYHVVVTLPADKETRTVTAGHLEVTDETPVVRRITPRTTLTRAITLSDRFDFEVVGERLGDQACKNAGSADCRLRLSIGNEPIELRECAPLTAEETKEAQRIGRGGTCEVTVGKSLKQDRCITWTERTNAVCVHNLTTGEFGGKKTIQVRTAGGTSNGVDVGISRITVQTIKWVTLVLFAAVIGLVVGFGRHVHQSPASNSTRLRLMSWALMDEQTNTYSLSKLQILAWVAVIIYSYVYFFLARVYVQGFDAVPRLPENLATLIGVTGGTSLVTMMLTRSRGSKGAGSAQPELADLVSSGGVLAPDRAQYLAWTVIGCIGYILVVLKASPDALMDLPKVDDTILQAMGLSALVYVGGKAVRLPGPVVNEVKPTASANALTLNIKGQNFHEKAIVSIDGMPVEAKLTANTPMSTSVSAALMSDITIDLQSNTWNTGDHLLRLTNIDGQFGETWFAVDAPVIDEVSDAPTNAAMKDKITAGATPITVTAKGSNFRLGSTAEWLAPGSSSPELIAASNVTVSSPTLAQIRFAPGANKGAGTVSLTSPRGIRASRQVTVV